MSLITRVNALQFVRAHSQMFFGEVAPNPITCAHELVAEVLALAAPDAAVERHGDWWIVSSTMDWFLPNKTVEEQFCELIPFAEGGANASRFEVVIAAFAAAVATRSKDTEWCTISGDGVPLGLSEDDTCQRAARAVAFRFASRA
jgi:hypothetical protein